VVCRLTNTINHPAFVATIVSNWKAVLNGSFRCDAAVHKTFANA
jgi:hypothetical protein